MKIIFLPFGLTAAFSLCACMIQQRADNTPFPEAALTTEAITTAAAESTQTEISTESTSESVYITTEAVTEQKSDIIAIDPGHQSRGNNEHEPIGPGALETKAKVSSGTSGKASGLNEYELNLAVSLKLRDILTKRGYSVVMTRQTNDVDISNMERAQIANSANAAAFVRIHANGSDDPSANGAMTICQTPQNPYNGNLYPQSHLLAGCILDSLTAQTGAAREKLWETDTMSGINWAAVPTTIVEIGYMTNAAEDLRMADEEQQTLIAKAIADGIEDYLNKKKEN